MKKQGFGLIELLLGILILSIVFVAIAPTINHNKTNTEEIKNVQQKVDVMTKEIEALKQQQAEYTKELQQQD